MAVRDICSFILWFIQDRSTDFLLFILPTPDCITNYESSSLASSSCNTSLLTDSFSPILSNQVSVTYDTRFYVFNAVKELSIAIVLALRTDFFVLNISPMLLVRTELNSIYSLFGSYFSKSALILVELILPLSTLNWNYSLSL